jgi:DNA-binding CsgD family transcriptional regulator
MAAAGLASGGGDMDMQFANLGAMAGLDKLTLAIGEEHFSEVLLDVARSVGDADHVMIFAFPPRATPRAVVSAGRIDAERTAMLTSRYCTELYLLDPNYPQIRKQAEGDPPAWFAFHNGAGCCDEFRDVFLTRCEVSDILSFAISQESMIYYVMFLRTKGREFASAQRWLLTQLGEMIAANVRKHFSYMHILKDKKQFVIGRILSESRFFQAVTARERAVCVGILTGHTSEGIGLNLAISINSVLTYRKRLYEKLHITSQNELFAKVIEAMMELGDADPPRDQAEKMLTPFLESMAQTALPSARLEAVADQSEEYFPI